MTRTTLKNQGYRVSSFTSDKEILKAAFEQPPDLLVMAMDSKSGQTQKICRQLKTDTKTNHIPIIFSGPQIQLKKLIDAVNYGADGYLLKPVQTEELLAKVKAFIRLTAHHQSLVEAKGRLEKEGCLLTARHKELEGLYKLNQDLSRCVDFNNVVKVLFEKARELLIVDRCFLQLLSESGTEVTELIGHDYEGKEWKHPNKPLDDVGLIIGEIKKTRRPIAITNAKNSSLLAKAFAYRNNLRTALFLPLTVKRRVIGIFLICRDSVKAFNDDELRLAMILATEVSTAIDRARLLEKSKDLQSTLKAVIEWGDSGIILVDANRIVRTANRKLGEMLGVDHERIIGQNERDCVVKKAKWLFKDPEAFEERLEWLRRQSSDVVTDYMEMTKPVRRALERFSGPVFDGSGKFIGRVDIYHDVTVVRKQSERRMRTLYKRERKIAQILQKNLLPRAVPTIKGFDIGTKYSAAVQGMVIGGDYYDFIYLSDHHLAFAIGDVCGKGITAAVQTYLVKYSLRAFAREDPDPAVVISRLNWTFCQEVEDGAFVTLAYILLDQQKSSLEYCVAGHPQPILYRPAKEKFEKLGTNGGIVGIVPDALYHSRMTRLSINDIAVFYTDGITEARCPSGFFGEENLKDIIKAAAACGAQEVADMIFAAVDKFTSSHLNDDAAIVVLKRTA